MSTSPEDQFLSLLDSSREARLCGNPQGALTFAGRADNLIPHEPAAYHTIALALADMGKHDRAFRTWEQAIGYLQPMETVPDGLLDGYREILFGFAWSLLRRGEWKRAWPYWEAGRIFAAWSPFPGTQAWQGECDGNLLVLPEGGYGDLFCFARFLTALDRSPIRPSQVGLCVQPRAKKLRDWKALGVDAVHEIGGEIPMGKYKYSTSLLSLPGFLGINAPSEVPYDYFPSRITHRVGSKPRIGFCWRAEEAGEANGRKVRTLPLPVIRQIVAQLLDKIDPWILNLCPGNDPEIPGLIHQEDCIEDCIATWEATADYMAGMDLILTVDTAVGHLSGLLGLDTLCLLPLNSCWRWLLDREDTVWYPPNFKLFRNQITTWEAEPIIEATIARVDALNLSGKSSTQPHRQSSHSKNS